MGERTMHARICSLATAGAQEPASNDYRGKTILIKQLSCQRAKYQVYLDFRVQPIINRRLNLITPTVGGHREMPALKGQNPLDFKERTVRRLRNL